VDTSDHSREDGRSQQEVSGEFGKRSYCKRVRFVAEVMLILALCVTSFLLLWEVVFGACALSAVCGRKQSPMRAIRLGFETHRLEERIRTEYLERTDGDYRHLSNLYEQLAWNYRSLGCDMNAAVALFRAQHNREGEYPLVAASLCACLARGSADASVVAKYADSAFRQLALNGHPDFALAIMALELGVALRKEGFSILAERAFALAATHEQALRGIGKVREADGIRLNLLRIHGSDEPLPGKAPNEPVGRPDE